MKRLLIAILALVLLTGCGIQDPGPTEPSATEKVVPVAQPYAQGQSLAEGAVTAYTLDDSTCLGMMAMGEDILLFFGGEDTRLMLLSGKDLTVLASATLQCSVLPGSTVQVSQRAIGYFDSAARCAVLLDGSLRESKRFPLPDDLQGSPIWSPRLDKVYYCTKTEIRVLDISTGVASLLKSQEVAWQELTQILMDGSVLACSVVEQDEDTYTAFLSTETGATIGTDTSAWGMETRGGTYVLQRTDGTVREILFGTQGEPVQSLTPQDPAEQAVSALAMGGVVTGCPLQEGEGTALTLYDLQSGRRTAAVELHGVAHPYYYLATEQVLWLLDRDSAKDSTVLYCWDVSKSPVDDETVYTGPRYTADSPDSAGLAACQVWADALMTAYGVDIRIAGDALTQHCDYELTEEFQTQPIESSLAALEYALSRYPEGFFRQVAENTQTGVLHICLVRDISRDMVGIQYWGDGDIYLALETGKDLEQTFYHELCHVIDTYVIGKSREYDDWEEMNPSDFSYDMSYDLYQNRETAYYLEGEDRAFIDSYSMTYPREDRARIMEYAMLPGQEEVFASRILQEKLATISRAIREAFQWEKDSRVFPWEVYLDHTEE